MREKSKMYFRSQDDIERDSFLEELLISILKCKCGKVEVQSCQIV
jgi:hypothetical protein